MTRRGRIQSIENFVQGGGAGNYTVWVEDVVPFGDNVKEGRRDKHTLLLSDIGESSEADKIRYIGDA